MKCIYCNTKCKKTLSITKPRYKCRKCPHNVNSSIIDEAGIWSWAFHLETENRQYDIIAFLNDNSVKIYKVKDRNNNFTFITWEFKNAIDKITPYNIESKLKTILTFQ